jgi:hypothetical protein
MVLYVIRTFPVDQADGVVIVTESFEFLSLVLKNPPVKIVGHADVERAAGAALHDVHVVVMFARHELPIPLSSRAENWFRSGGTRAESRDLVFLALVLRLGGGWVCDGCHIICVAAKRKVPPLRLLRFASVGMTGLLRFMAANARRGHPRATQEVCRAWLGWTGRSPVPTWPVPVPSATEIPV